MIWIYADREAVKLLLRGHARAAPYGQDLVCAAISALCQTLALALREAEKKGRVRQVEISLKPGCGELICGWAGEEMKAVYSAFCRGFEALAEEYPRYLRFTRSREAFEERMEAHE